MSDTVFDAGSTTLDFLADNADKVVAVTPQDITFSIQQVITNETFYAWIILAVVTTLFTTQGWRFTSDIYSRIFARPAYIVAISIAAFVADVLMASALIYYIWTQRHPPPGQASEWYAAIYGLWFAAEGLKYFWVILFWRWGLTVPGICGAAFLGAVTNLVLVVLIITSGYRQSFGTMGMVIVAWLIYMFAFVCNCIIAYYRVTETPVANAEVTSAILMTQISRPPMQQQQQQQQQYQTPANRPASCPVQQRPPVYGQPANNNSTQTYQRHPNVPQPRTMNNNGVR